MTAPMIATAGPLAMGDGEFDAWRSWIRRESGLFLSESKRAFLVARLARRVRELGLGSFGDYLASVVSDDTGLETVRAIDSVVTNETRFFREPRQMEFLVDRVFAEWNRPALRTSRTVRVWSAACSTGEEPYTLAVLLARNFPATAGWRTEVIATDISSTAVAAAREAIFSAVAAEQIPEAYLRDFVKTETGDLRPNRAARSLVRVERANLVGRTLGVEGPFTLILCRNVLMFFDREERLLVVERLLERLDARGLLMVGHAENLLSLTRELALVGPGTYAFRTPRTGGR